MPLPQKSLIARSRPLFFLFGLFFLTWPDMFFPLQIIPAFSTRWFAFSAIKNALRVCIILIAMKRWEGFDSFLLRTRRFLPSSTDLFAALVVCSAAGLVALGLAGLSLLVGLRNPLDFSIGDYPMNIVRVICIGAVSLGVGYSEELFFRYLTPTALERAGFSAVAATTVAIILFGLSHGSQGLIGMVQSSLLALIFFYFRSKGDSLHALALGHALYDFVLLVALA